MSFVTPWAANPSQSWCWAPPHKERGQRTQINKHHNAEYKSSYIQPQQSNIDRDSNINHITRYETIQVEIMNETLKELKYKN